MYNKNLLVIFLWYYFKSWKYMGKNLLRLYRTSIFIASTNYLVEETELHLVAAVLYVDLS